MYLAVILDFCLRKIVFYVLSRSLTGEVVARVLERALFQRTMTPRETIFHSDRGCQFGIDEVKNHSRFAFRTAEHGCDESLLR